MGSTPKLVCVLPDLVQVVDLIVITVYACHGKDLLGIGYSRRDISISVIKGYTDQVEGSSGSCDKEAGLCFPSTLAWERPRREASLEGAILAIS